MRREWQAEELLAQWTVLPGDWPLVGNKHGPTRLGFTVLLKFFQSEGRLPCYPHDDYYYGLGETLQDYSEAMRLYKQAARLGAVQAYCRLGQMYVAGEGCAQDLRKALDFFKEGAKKGDTSCYAEMARLFTAEHHLENARKCWDRFFTGGRVNSDSVLVGHYCYDYFNSVRRYSWPLDHLDALRQVKDKLQKTAEEVLKYAKEHGGFVALCEERLNAIQHTL